MIKGNQYTGLLLGLCGCVLLLSCEKVIDVRIGDTDKKYVIEGTISDNTNSCKVNLSQTINITDSNKFEGISGADITIQEDNGVPVEINDAGGGIYRANLSGKPGHTYTLKVKINGETFESTSTMPQKVFMDSIYVTERLFLGKLRKLATAEFKDPPGLGNAYRLVQYIDGRKENTIFAFDDNLIDGRIVKYELLIFGDENYTLKKDDQLRIELRCIDLPNFTYWYSLTQGALGQNQSASPDNPVSNIRGGALGYFSANTFEAKSMAVQ